MVANKLEETRFTHAGEFLWDGWFEYLLAQSKQGKLAIFCGAGISNGFPSNKPLGDELKDFMIDSLIVARNTSLEKSKLRSQSLEQFISKTGWNVESCLEDVFSDKHSQPNIWHFLIATLMKRGFVKCVFTTNFDPLIETALKILGCKKIDDYLVVSNERYELPKTENPAFPIKPTIFYLHGTYIASEMCITIPHILDPFVSNTRLRSLTRFLSEDNRTLLVFGYSARDRDIQNELKYCSSEIFSFVRTTSARIQKPDGCFKACKESKIFVNNYLELVNNLWNKFGLGEKPNIGNKINEYDENWITFVKSWIDKLSLPAIEYIIQRLQRTQTFESSLDKVRITIKLKHDIVTIVGDIISINTKGNAKNYHQFSDCDASQGVLVLESFVRRMRALGYLTKSRDLDFSIFNKSQDLCNLAEEEMKSYIDEIMNEIRSSRGFHDHQNYQEFISKAHDVLTHHDLLHALVE